MFVSFGKLLEVSGDVGYCTINLIKQEVFWVTYPLVVVH